MSTSLEELFQQGVKNLSEGNFLEAEKCFEKLHNSNPKNQNILKNLLVSYVQNKKFEKSEKIIQTMFALGLKEKKLIELLLFIYKEQDKIQELKELISKEVDVIDNKYKLQKQIERPAILMSKEEIKLLRNIFLKILTKLFQI